MKTVKIKNIVIGEGAPKVIVPLMGKDLLFLVERADAMRQEADFDILEWRADYFGDTVDTGRILNAARVLRDMMPEKPLFFTFRTASEGGRKDISLADYLALHAMIADSKTADLIDLELGAGEEPLKKAAAYARSKGVKVVLSSHDFAKTPSQQEIVSLLCKMQRLGGDILKVAFMPDTIADVLTLLAANAEMYEKYADRPIIAISMSKKGMISRFAGEIFGSAATFAFFGSSSAPGQIDVNVLKPMLETIHRL